MDVLSEIIEWAKTLPKWQQLAVKHTLDGTKFDATVINEILAAALDDNKVQDGLLDSFSSEAKVSSTVSLVDITELNNINNLNDAETLSFSTTGLTVVYGQNGSGKSGYSRIIKKCCRSRDKKTDILGNIHDPSNKEQSAKINYIIDGIAKAYVWDNSADGSTDLQSIHVFDRPSGDAYLSKEADIQYKPAGMDVLDKLIEVIKEIDIKLQERVNKLQITDLEPLFQNEHGETEATKLVRNLGVHNAREQYDILSRLNEEELFEQETLSESIQRRTVSSPAKERENLSKSNDSLRSVKSYFSVLLALISDQKTSFLNSKIAELKTAQENADNAKKLTFDSSQFLAGTGNDAWKVMWRAAEKFSKEFAYIGEEYPPELENAKCVLCQQPLDSKRADNMVQFGNYVNNESQKILTQCKSAIGEELASIRGMIKKAEDEDVLIKSIETDYPVYYKELISQLPSIRKTILVVISALEEPTEIIIDTQAVEPWRTLESEINAVLVANDAELEKPLDDAEFKTLLDADNARLNGFMARKALETHRELILKNIELLPERKKLEDLRKQCNTSSISSKTTELSKKYIIGTLSQSFDDELKNITNNRIGATLIPAGTKQGIPHSKIVLQLKGGASYYDKLGDVLSEGELRGASLAGFFAELSMTDNLSAIVFDDPVSSLDHINAERIADRIVKEAEKRQVIVFTHDILFVSYIVERIRGEKQVNFKTIDSLTKAGLVASGLPFEKMNVKARIGKLKNTLQNEIRSAFKNNQAVEYRILAEQFYKDLRLSWERAVEEILFGDVVKRFSRNVATQQLRNVKYSPENAKIVEQNMTNCSKKLLHDPALGEEVDLGTPDDLARDLKTLEDFNSGNPRN